MIKNMTWSATPAEFSYVCDLFLGTTGGTALRPFGRNHQVISKGRSAAAVLITVEQSAVPVQAQKRHEGAMDPQPWRPPV